MPRVAPRAPSRAETPAADAPSKTPWLLGLLVLVAALAFAAWRLARG
jgi:hypothetical protein